MDDGESFERERVSKREKSGRGERAGVLEDVNERMIALKITMEKNRIKLIGRHTTNCRRNTTGGKILSQRLARQSHFKDYYLCETVIMNCNRYHERPSEKHPVDVSIDSDGRFDTVFEIDEHTLYTNGI